MAIDLSALRETAKGHNTELLVKKRDTRTLTDSPRISQKSVKMGRPNKKENQHLTQRINLILTEEQREILNQRRGANTIGEIDTSSFIREWLVRTKCFDASNPIQEVPTSNLP
jgi:hypothetical protein